MKNTFKKEFFIAFLIIMIPVLTFCGYMFYVYMELEESVQNLQVVVEEAMEDATKLKEEAKKAYHDGYDVYFDGIRLNPEDVKIDSLLENSTVAVINHEDKCVELIKQEERSVRKVKYFPMPIFFP